MKGWARPFGISFFTCFPLYHVCDLSSFSIFIIFFLITFFFFFLLFLFFFWSFSMQCSHSCSSPLLSLISLVLLLISLSPLLLLFLLFWLFFFVFFLPFVCPFLLLPIVMMRSALFPPVWPGQNLTSSGNLDPNRLRLVCKRQQGSQKVPKASLQNSTSPSKSRVTRRHTKGETPSSWKMRSAYLSVEIPKICSCNCQFLSVQNGKPRVCDVQMHAPTDRQEKQPWNHWRGVQLSYCV